MLYQKIYVYITDDKIPMRQANTLASIVPLSTRIMPIDIVTVPPSRGIIYASSSLPWIVSE